MDRLIRWKFKMIAIFGRDDKGMCNDVKYECWV